jgi:hypothetical protein
MRWRPSGPPSHSTAEIARRDVEIAQLDAEIAQHDAEMQI